MRLLMFEHIIGGSRANVAYRCKVDEVAASQELDVARTDLSPPRAAAARSPAGPANQRPRAGGQTRLAARGRARLAST